MGTAEGIIGSGFDCDDSRAAAAGLLHTDGGMTRSIGSVGGGSTFTGGGGATGGVALGAGATRAAEMTGWTDGGVGTVAAAA